jgi:hypothetical protein
MNPPSENHATATDDTQDWIVEKFQLGKIKVSAALPLAVSMIREIVAEGCRVSHDAMLCFQQRVHLLIASILIVAGDEFRMLDELPSPDLPGGGVSRRANYGLPDVKGPESHPKEFRQCSRLSCSEKLSRRKRLHYR